MQQDEAIRRKTEVYVFFCGVRHALYATCEETWLSDAPPLRKALDAFVQRQVRRSRWECTKVR